MSNLAIAEAALPALPAQPASYRSLIEQAYIGPIRSVSIVDDDFPTLEGFLNNNPARKPEDIDRLKKLIAHCRGASTRWLIDVHDGSESSVIGQGSNLEHLHQSDLLILDYHLDGDQRTDKAINIIRKLAKNDHFNLVVVYTKGYGGNAGELSRVGLEIAHALSNITDKYGRFSTEVPQLLEEWEEDDEQIMRKLLDSIDLSALLQLANDDGWGWDLWKKLPAFESLSQIILDRQKAKKTSFDEVAQWAIRKRISEVLEGFAKENYGQVRFSTHANNIWIRTDKLFVAVVGKATEPSQLCSRLVDALEHWNPSPHRLIMAKLRAELDTYGVGAESAVLSKKYIQAGWLNQLLSASDAERPWRIREAMTRHWEEMSGVVQGSVEAFAKSICNAACAGMMPTDVVKTYTDVDMADGMEVQDVKLHLNCYVCSKDVTGHHLAPGHILRMGTGADEEFWLCLSPACDLVPGQSQRWGKETARKLMPFKAVLLTEVTSIAAALKSATQNETVFF